jgi:DNA modification methylase
MDVLTRNTANYQEFLQSKSKQVESCGIDVSPDSINPMLFGFQQEIVKWALHRGRAAIFTATGTGKTFMYLEWGRILSEYTKGTGLIFAPLAVTTQTVREGKKLGIDVNICRCQEDIKPGANITNYEMIHKFSPEGLSWIVLDESSILKSFGGIMRKQITDFAKGIPFRLACTATPAPNDLIEIINHAEFLDIMTGKEIIALYFKQDGNTTHQWRLKHHAVHDFYQWLSKWAVAIRKPSDLGYSDEGFIRPPVNWQQVIVDVTADPKDALFHVEAKTLQERLYARRTSMDDRVRTCADLVNASSDVWVVWCNLNTESQALIKAIPDAVEITGSESPEAKERKLIDFIDGKIRVLVSKPSIAGYGLNLQHCHNTAYVGLSDSFEDLHQSISRFDRYGQQKQVNAYVITAITEGAVLQNINRKRRQFDDMMDELVKHMGDRQLGRCETQTMTYAENKATGKDWTLYLGDSIGIIDKIETESVDLIAYSPPFPGMYAYTNSPHDIGNTTTIDQMVEHYRYLVGKDKLLRILKPGRLHCVHLMQLTAMNTRDGYIGVKDYRGRVIAMMEDEGWIYAGEVCIDKNPQIQATRNKERGLLFKSLANDSSVMRMALADYVLLFRKPGENAVPIRAGISERYNNPNGWITEDEWVEWAAPVWYRHVNPEGKFAKQQPFYPSLGMTAQQEAFSGELINGVKETDVLNVSAAREKDDERHLCPLQLCVIERIVKLWSNPGDLVLSPFAGIGSEGYMSLKLNRRFVGIELKQSYFNTAVKNLKEAVNQSKVKGLFDEVEAQEPTV